MTQHAREVVVPATLARPVLRLLIRALTADVRAHGRRAVPPGIDDLLRDLHHATDPDTTGGALPHTSPMSDVGHPEPAPDNVDHGMGTVAQVAEDTGYSPRQLRRLAAAGRIRARRLHARGWLIDPTSLKDYRQGRT